MEDEGIELVVKDSKPPSNYDGKVRFINSILAEIKIRKQKHYKKVSLYKKINTTVKAIINGLNAVSVCSIIVGMTPISSFIMILALTTTTVSGISTAVIQSIDLEEKLQSHNTSNLHYNDLFRDISGRILRNGLSSEDLDSILGELNARLSLIEDSSPPID
jgi:hypothetical protein